jgi:hypothetical protein
MHERTHASPPAAVTATAKPAFFGWRVVGGTFVLAVFGWGLGFYGPPVFLSVLHAKHGWSVALISAAITVHFLVGAALGAGLHTLHRRFGAAVITKAGALCMALGIAGWAAAAAPWQLFLAAALSGAGWSTMSAAAINAIVAPWFVRARPAALAMAYNGGSVGGIIFSPLWVAAIAALGFPLAAVLIALVMVVTLWMLADLLFAHSPETMGLSPDGDDPAAGTAASVTSAGVVALPGAQLWRDLKFLTLCAGMAFGLFAQIGLVAHLFSLLAPALGAQPAGVAMGLVTVLAILGRTVLGWLLPPGADRRLVACAGYAAQLAGSVAFIAAAGNSVPLLMVGVVLFGIGFGNATSLPPLIAQVEFVKDDVPRAVSLMVGAAQASYAFAPAAFGLIRDLSAGASGAAAAVFAAAACVQMLAICALMAGRRARR